MIQIDMPMPRYCGECPLCMIVHDTCAYCKAGGFQVKYSELDLKDGLCPLIEIKPTALEGGIKEYGKWIETQEEYISGVEIHYVCSNCRDYSYFPTNYCPNCGTYMDTIQGENDDVESD